MIDSKVTSPNSEWTDLIFFFPFPSLVNFCFLPFFSFLPFTSPSLPPSFLITLLPTSSFPFSFFFLNKKALCTAASAAMAVRAQACPPPSSALLGRGCWSCSVSVRGPVPGGCSLCGKGLFGGWTKPADRRTAWSWWWPHSRREKSGGTVLSTTGSWWKMKDALGEWNEVQMALIVSLAVTTDKRNSALLTFKRYQKYQWPHSTASWRFPCQGVQTPLYFHYWTVHKNRRW